MITKPRTAGSNMGEELPSLLGHLPRSSDASRPRKEGIEGTSTKGMLTTESTPGVSREGSDMSYGSKRNTPEPSPGGLYSASSSDTNNNSNLLRNSNSALLVRKESFPNCFPSPNSIASTPSASDQFLVSATGVGFCYLFHKNLLFFFNPCIVLPDWSWDVFRGWKRCQTTFRQLDPKAKEPKDSR